MKQREGYLLIDHRASPGLPEDVARQAGYDPALCREGKMFEAATLTCRHCKIGVVKNLFRQRERHKCAKCGYAYICDFCAADMERPDYVHTPFEKLVDDTFNNAHKRMFCDTPLPLLASVEFYDKPKLTVPL